MKNKKSIVFLVLLILMGIVGTTYAYFTQSAVFDNEFSIKNFDVVIEEDFEDDSFLGCTSISDVSVHYCSHKINKDVFVVNKEDVPAVVRISYNEELVYDGYSNNNYRDLFDMECDESGECLSVNNTYGDDYSFTKVWTQDFLDNWYFYEGWYYYKKVLLAKESIQVLDGVNSNFPREGINGDYNLDFNIEAVQASSDAVKELWNQDVTINEDGTVYWGFENLEAEQ